MCLLLLFLLRPDCYRGLDVGLHPVRVRRAGGVRGHPVQATDRGGRPQGPGTEERIHSLLFI